MEGQLSTSAQRSSLSRSSSASFGQGSQADPVASPSGLAWSALAITGQLSVASTTVSPSSSVSQTSP